jgi:hypothetical protein
MMITEHQTIQHKKRATVMDSRQKETRARSKTDQTTTDHAAGTWADISFPSRGEREKETM